MQHDAVPLYLPQEALEQLMAMPYDAFVRGPPKVPCDVERARYVAGIGITDKPPDPQVRCGLQILRPRKRWVEMHAAGESRQAGDACCRRLSWHCWSLAAWPNSAFADEACRISLLQVEHILTLISRIFSIENVLVSLCAHERVFIRNARGFAPGVVSQRPCRSKPLKQTFLCSDLSAGPNCSNDSLAKRLHCPSAGDFPWRWGFCGWGIATPNPEVLVVEDALEDARCPAYADLCVWSV